jgi:hypothetical protein
LAGTRKNNLQPPEPGAATGEHRPDAADAGGARRENGDPIALILAPVFLVEVAWLVLLVYLGWRLLSTL